MTTCTCGFGHRWELTKFSAEWHRQHRDHHLGAYPDVDRGTRDNLAMFIEWAERREATSP